VIISGLALGVDGIAHTACLDAGGITVAVLANGLDSIYPASHTALARRIVEQGGTIISEYPQELPACDTSLSPATGL
jgi:DNA processing protein